MGGPIRDFTETDLINLRRTIYLTIMSAMDFEEAGHKLLKIALADGQEIEVVTMLIECCSQEKTYLRCARLPPGPVRPCRLCLWTLPYCFLVESLVVAEDRSSTGLFAGNAGTMGCWASASRCCTPSGRRCSRNASASSTRSSTAWRPTRWTCPLN